MYRLTISYAAVHFNKFDGLAEKIASKFKGECTGSGCGMGYRDMDFEFKTEQERDLACKEFQKDKNFSVNY